MTLCPSCAAEHGDTVRFAAVIIDAELAGRRRSQASADLKAMLPPAMCGGEPRSGPLAGDSPTPHPPVTEQPFTRPLAAPTDTESDPT